jgi:hypothetical protein
MPGDSGVTVVTNSRVFFYTRGRGRFGRPAFPAPLLGSTAPSDSGGWDVYAKLGRIAQRECVAALTRNVAVVFESGDSVASHTHRHSGMRLLAQARNPYSRRWLWIPGSRFARPGMTKVMSTSLSSNFTRPVGPSVAACARLPSLMPMPLSAETLPIRRLASCRRWSSAWRTPRRH